MKIAVFENEYHSVKGAFEAANLLGFGGELVITNYASSQKANFSRINEFAAIFVDIDLSSKSDLDGFGVIQKIKGQSDDLLRNVIILTGNNNIVDVMNERGVYDERISIIYKPTDYEEITNVIKKVQL